jgi:hypothetical protein
MRPTRRPSTAAMPGRTTRSTNPSPAQRNPHRIKTFAGWEVHQPFPGIYLWRDPYGALYLVDHTGTRRIGQHGTGEEAA